MTDQLVERHNVHIKEGHLVWEERGTKNASGDFESIWHTNGFLDGRGIGDTELNGYITRYWPAGVNPSTQPAMPGGSSRPQLEEKGLRVLAAVADLRRAGGRPAVRDLVQHTSFDRDSVIRWVRHLQETGYIRAIEATTLAAEDYIDIKLTATGETEVEAKTGGALDAGPMLLLPISRQETATLEGVLGWLTDAAQNQELGPEVEERLRAVLGMIQNEQWATEAEVTPRWKLIGAVRSGLGWLIPVGGHISGWHNLIEILRKTGWLEAVAELLDKLPDLP